jgi:hypothetical protein
MVEYEMPYERDALYQLAKYSREYKKYPNNYVVEIGCSYNSWLLNEPLHHLRGIRIDADMNKILGYGAQQFPVKSICAKVSSKNICKILEDNNVPEDFFMLCLDIDGPDFFVLLAILKKYRPKIILTEFTEVIPYPVKFAIKANDDFVWSGGAIYGYSIACAEDIMKKFNYNMDECIVNNIFLVRNDLDEKPNVGDVEEFYRKGYLFSEKYPRTDVTLFSNEYNKPLNFLQELKPNDVISSLRQYYIDNPVNPYNNKSTIENLNNYVDGKDYEEYLENFLKQ